MPDPPNAGSDIGPLPDASAQGSPPSKPATDAAALGPREVHPDVAEPILEPTEEAAVEPAEAAKGSSDKAPPLEAPKTDQKQITSPKPAESWPAIDCSKPRAEVEAAITDCMKTKYGTALVADMDDAQILLSYLTRNGLQEERKVSDDTIKTLIAARQHLRTGVFDCEKEEPQFRKDYGVIAKAAAPVTVASLRDSLPTRPQRRWFIFMEGEPRSIAERKCFKYRDAAFFVLLLLLVSQIYWTITSSVLNKSDVLISEINKAPTEAVYLAQEAARQNAITSAKQQTTVESTSPKPTPSQATPQASPQANPLKPNPPSPNPTEAVDKAQLTLDELVSKLAELDANYAMLSKLVTPVASKFFPEDIYVFELSPAAADKDKGKQPKDTPAKDPKDIFVPSHFQTQSATIRAVAGQVIDVMQKWWLPLLYGALGAMVFVVRTLSLQARDRLFRKEALVSLNLRVFLGAISGLAIGWFWSQSAQTPTTAGPMSLTTLSPFALAFVAGYGVELFFTLLDKIVSTFTNKP